MAISCKLEPAYLAVAAVLAVAQVQAQVAAQAQAVALLFRPQSAAPKSDAITYANSVLNASSTRTASADKSVTTARAGTLKQEPAQTASMATSYRMESAPSKQAGQPLPQHPSTVSDAPRSALMAGATNAPSVTSTKMVSAGKLVTTARPGTLKLERAPAAMTAIA